ARPVRRERQCVQRGRTASIVLSRVTNRGCRRDRRVRWDAGERWERRFRHESARHCAVSARGCPCLASNRADSKCRGLIAKSIEDNSRRLDSTFAMTRHRSSSSSAAAPMLPPIVIALMAPFRSFFTAPVWEHVLVLVTGMVLAPGKRTVSAALRVMGLGATRDFALYHYVLSRARWNSRAIARTLLTMILDRFLPSGPVVIGINDTIERRWGRKIAARGIYRDPVRSSHGHFVKTSGLRWLSLMAMVPIPWTRRRWALPFLTILAPSKRYHVARN